MKELYAGDDMYITLTLDHELNYNYEGFDGNDEPLQIKGKLPTNSFEELAKVWTSLNHVKEYEVEAYLHMHGFDITFSGYEELIFDKFAENNQLKLQDNSKDIHENIDVYLFTNKPYFTFSLSDLRHPEVENIEFYMEDISKIITHLFGSNIKDEVDSNAFIWQTSKDSPFAYLVNSIDVIVEMTNVKIKARKGRSKEQYIQVIDLYVQGICLPRKIFNEVIQPYIDQLEVYQSDRWDMREFKKWASEPFNVSGINNRTKLYDRLHKIINRILFWKV